MKHSETCKYSSLSCLHSHFIKGRSSSTWTGSLSHLKAVSIGETDWVWSDLVWYLVLPGQVAQTRSAKSVCPQLDSTRLWSLVYLRRNRGRRGWRGLLCSSPGEQTLEWLLLTRVLWVGKPFLLRQMLFGENVFSPIYRQGVLLKTYLLTA